MSSEKKRYVMHIDSNDNPVGLIPKVDAHLKGIRHKAFSVLIFNQFGEMLIQKRAKEKYHSGGLWSNACCSHQITEDVLFEAKERLLEELGIQCSLRNLFTFHYSEVVSNEMIENETDEVLVGIMNRCDVYPNPVEAEKVKWVEYTGLVADIRINPDKYTVWFKIIIDMLQNSYLALIEKEIKSNQI